MRSLRNVRAARQSRNRCDTESGRNDRENCSRKRGGVSSAGFDNEAAYGRLKEILRIRPCRWRPLRITEKGYSLVNGKGEQLADVTADFAAGPEKPASYMGKVTSLLYARYKAGELPIAMVSTDNCSHNGDKLYAAIAAFAKAMGRERKSGSGICILHRF